MNVVFCTCLVFFYIRIYLLPSVLPDALSQNRFHCIGLLSHGKEKLLLLMPVLISSGVSLHNDPESIYQFLGNKECKFYKEYCTPFILI